MISATNFFCSARAPTGSVYLMSDDVSPSRVHTLWASRVNFVQIHFVNEAPECSCPACCGLSDDVVDGCETYHKED